MRSFIGSASVGRLGFVDVDLHDPARVIGFSRTPILPDPALGTFDCDGVTPLSIVSYQDEIRLYYAGWFRLTGGRARYRLLTGLAISRDGNQFSRYRDTPLIPPPSSKTLVRTAGAVIHDRGVWHCFYADDIGLVQIGAKYVPRYRLCLMKSPDGLIWPDNGPVVFEADNGIIGYGRSAVWREGGVFHGLFSVRRRRDGYRAIEYAVSQDGNAWSTPGVHGLAFTAGHTRDGQNEVCFPSIVSSKDDLVMFYNGDKFGVEGLRVAVWSGLR